MAAATLDRYRLGVRPQLLHAVCLLALIVAVSVPLSAAAQSPAQATGLAATHRSGQTFITWTERTDLVGERYRVYRHSEPIAAANLAQAELLYQVPEGSGGFYADRFQSGGTWQARYVDRFIIEDGGARLDTDTSLLVWTLAAADFRDGRSGEGYYAVTTVDSAGTENLDDFGPENSIGPIAEEVSEPRPVEILNGTVGLAHVYIQYMDVRRWNPTFHAPNPGNQYYGLDPADPVVASAIQYAYTYSVSEPDPANCGGDLPAQAPLIMVLHGWEGNTYGPRVGATATYCAYEIHPVDVSETWWFGFAQQHDYRQASAIEAGDVIANYTEERVLRMIYDLLRDPQLGPRIDPDRIYVWGHSMGGTGALALALRYPNVFAAAYASEPMTDFRQSGGWADDAASKWGPPDLNLPVAIEAPGGWADHLALYAGTGVWDWQDLAAAAGDRSRGESAPVGVGAGLLDVTAPWETQGQPAFAALEAGQRAWAGVLSDSEHVWQAFAGLPPTLGLDVNGAPFAGLMAARDESLPALSNASGNAALDAGVVGGWNQAIEWSSTWNPWDGAPVDMTDRWQVALRTTDGAAHTVDVTPARLQAFRVNPGATYRWENRSASDNSVVASGTVEADQLGFLSVTAFAVSPERNRLLLWPQRAAPVPTATSESLGGDATPLPTERGVEWSPPVVIFEGDEAIANPVLLADSQGSVHLLWMYGNAPSIIGSDADEGLRIYYSHLANDSWSDPVDIEYGRHVSSARPVVAATHDGYLHLLFGGEGNELLHARVATGNAVSAKEWRTTSAMSEVGIGASIVADGSGRLHLVFPGLDTSGLYYITSDDSGTTWSAPETIVPASASNLITAFTHLSLDGAGAIHVVWSQLKRNDSFTSAGVYYSNSGDGGRTWADPVQIAGDDYTQGALAVDAGNAVHVVWNGIAGVGGRYHRWSADGGRTWSEPVLVSPPGLGGIEGEPQLAVDSAGVVHLLMTYSGCAWYSHWETGEWSQPECISGAEAMASGYVEEPALVIAGGNQLHAVFWDDRARLWYTTKTVAAPRLASERLIPLLPTAEATPAVPTAAPDVRQEATPTARPTFTSDGIPTGSRATSLPAAVLPAALLIGVAALAKMAKGRSA